MIPKKIHYCWFGNRPLNDNEKRCINSWKKFFPDYEIIEWNEVNYDLKANEYLIGASEAQKWAFVSDFARMDIMYKYGGIYFDVDVEVLKDMSPIIEKGPYLGREQERDGASINSGLGFACEGGENYLKEIIKEYSCSKFYNELKLNKTQPQLTTEYFIKNGFDIKKDADKIQEIDGIRIYPGEYFCPKGYDGKTTYTDNTYSIHLYSASWLSPLDRRILHASMNKNNVNAFIRIFIIVYLKILLLIKKIRREK